MGINTIYPTSHLDVSGNFKVSGSITGNRLFVSSDLSLNGRLFATNDVSFGGKLFVSSDLSLNGRLFVNSDVSFGGKQTVAGNVTALNFISTSDYRIKDNVLDLNGNFFVDHLRPVSYVNKISNSKAIGFIAHEVQEIYPELVNGVKDGEELQSLNYIGLIGVLVKEIKSLKLRVKDLESKFP